MIYIRQTDQCAFAKPITQPINTHSPSDQHTHTHMPYHIRQLDQHIFAVFMQQKENSTMADGLQKAESTVASLKRTVIKLEAQCANMQQQQLVQKSHSKKVSKKNSSHPKKRKVVQYIVFLSLFVLVFIFDFGFCFIFCPLSLFPPFSLSLFLSFSFF